MHRSDKRLTFALVLTSINECFQVQLILLFDVEMSRTQHVCKEDFLQTCCILLTKLLMSYLIACDSL